MKNILLLVIPWFISAQTPEIKTNLTPKEVTVYLSGAQVTSEAIVVLPKGTSQLIFSGLSPYIDQGSIQVSGLKEASVLAISYNINYLDKKIQSEKIQEIQSKIKLKQRDIALLQNQIAGLEQEKELLKNNQKINSNETDLSVEKITNIAKYYRERITSITTEIYDAQQKITLLQKDLGNLSQEFNKELGTAKEQRGEITVKVDAPNVSNLTLMVKYNVTNAGWFPVYDIKTNSTKDPVQVYYKAHVYQQTSDNWNDVKINLSTGDPSLNNEKPDLQPHYLNYTYGYNPSTPVSRQNFKYNPSIRLVQGIVSDNNGPLAGVNVIVKGTQRGTQTDFDGKYTIAIGSSEQELEFSYLGMETKVLPIYAQQINVVLKDNAKQLQEVVITGARAIKKSDFDGYADSEVIAVDKLAGKVSGLDLTPTATGDYKSDNVTQTLFRIAKNYTIASHTDVTVIPIDQFSIPSEYEYLAIPVLNQNVFLTAKIKNWEQYDLISGEANVYFEGNYAGKTFIDPNQTQEELVISLGMDPNLVVERKQTNSLKDKSLLGTTRLITKNYEITLKNNKQTDLEIVLKDRIPISQNKEIKVEKITHSGTDYDEKTGVITWKVPLKSKETTKKEFSYEVKFPKDNRINL